MSCEKIFALREIKSGGPVVEFLPGSASFDPDYECLFVHFSCDRHGFSSGPPVCSHTPKTYGFVG